MNIYGLIATIIVCLTLITITVMILKQFKIKPIVKPKYRPKIKNIIKSDDEPYIMVPKADYQAKSNKELEEELNKQSIASASMDAVIQAANRVMGINVQEDEDEERK